MRNSFTFLIYGEGGHSAQMNRLLNNLNQDSTKLIHIVDSKNLVLGEKYYYCRPLRKKSNNTIFYTLISIIISLFLALKLFILYRPKSIISTGPAFCFLFFIIGKVTRSKLIFIETWSRFYTKSQTAKLIYPIADMFLYQNVELKKIYPKGIYSGRL
ncbi:PssD/Cps14F family polysaccharide biosynthesis glycosyltransferase [Vibrio chagasii]|uniref:Polysaccharide biosynthesis protein n=1 Tax=Vibrio chagasii TaxID=170679 RepID=A0A7Y4DTR5_9VIBR|nr:polysaccharide biosynthesis protein [Vibrio chagasii]